MCSNLRRASRVVSNYYDRVLARISNLRISQVIVLVVLCLTGPLTINELADKLTLDRTTLGRNLRPIAQQHLLTMTPGSDQRTKIVTLTSQGEEILLRVLPQWEQAQAHMVMGIGQEQLAPFLAQLARSAQQTSNP